MRDEDARQLAGELIGLYAPSGRWPELGVLVEFWAAHLEAYGLALDREIMGEVEDGQRKKPRWLQRFRAWLGAYYWLPCVICGEFYGGHESGGTWWHEPGRGRDVCVNCADEAAARSVEVLEKERELQREWLEEELGPGALVIEVSSPIEVSMGGGRFGL